MQTRDMAILLIALVVVVAMAVVVKPMLTGKPPDLTLPSFPGGGSDEITPDDTLPVPGSPAIPAGTHTPALTESPPVWDGTPVSLGYISHSSNGGVSPAPAATAGTSFSPGDTPSSGAETSPAASFNGTPRRGPVPLTVQFTDTSTGFPAEWMWSFGDGATSTLRNPIHTYTSTGNFQVGLTVKNSQGGNTRIIDSYILVSPAGERSIFAEIQRGAHVIPGGFIEFTVTQPGARIKIRGRMVDLPQGTRIRMVVEDSGKGKISIREGFVVAFTFEQAAVYIDNTLIERGAVREVNVPGYENCVSSINLEIDGGYGDILILENGDPSSLSDIRDPIIFISLRPDSFGVMNLDCFRTDATFFQGAVTDFYPL